MSLLWGSFYGSHKATSNLFLMSNSENEVAQSCPTLWDPMDCSLPGFFVHGIFQARVLEWVAISFSRGSSCPRDQTQASCIAGRCFTLWATREAQIMVYLILYYTILNQCLHLLLEISSFSDCVFCWLQSFPNLFNPMGSRVPGSSVHRINLARTLEYVAISSSRGPS